jgi:manganese transport protein
MAILLQHLSLKLGIATGRDLAQACRDHFSPPVALMLWVLCEIAIAACDLAEVIGSAIALNLLFGIPLVAGVLLTAADVLVVLLLQHRGFRYIEVMVGGLVFLIGGCFVYELLAAQPALAALAGGLVPSPQIVTNPGALYIAIGILGATVMPHNLYLHSSIVQTRAFERTEPGKRSAIKFATIDSTVALLFAFFINAAILVTAAAAFHGTAHADVADINDAYMLLTPMLGATFASTLFGVALLASGQNSTLTGTLAGQIVMEGFLNIRGTGELLVLSQVILSLQLSFAVIPLVMFTSDKLKMGPFVNPRWLNVLAWAVTAIIVVLNSYLLFQTFGSWLSG